MRRALVLVIASFIAVACRSGRFGGDVGTWQVASADPIGAVGHGGILDPRGNDVEPTAAFVLGAQRFYLRRLYDRANEQQRADLNARLRRLTTGRSLTEPEQIFVNAALLEWFIDVVKPADAADLVSKNAVLRNRFFRSRAPATSVSPELLERLRQEGLIKPLSATTAGGEAYRAECRAAGVPIPPDWGNPAWQSRGNLGIKFIVKNEDAELFSFQSNEPRGICLALPRSSGNTINALGIICLGLDTGHSCYWDNIDKSKTPFPITKGSSVPIANFGGGAELVGGNGVCTDCHAGENPYVVHPGQPMDLGIVPKSWTDPLVDPSWPQNTGPTNALTSVVLGSTDGSCLTCHGKDRRFPDVSVATPGYCTTILQSAYNTSGTMPVGDVGNPKYKKHFDALQATCKEPPRDPIQVVINGATQSTPTGGRSDTGGDLGPCTDPKNCPLGFCYWKTLHGPFWQQTDASIPAEDPKYRGSFVRIYGEGGKWKWRAFSDATGLPPNAPPGGTAECTVYKHIANVPDPMNCFANLWMVADPKGTDLSTSVDATGPGVTANALTGYIGNVAQGNMDASPDFLRVFEQSGKVLLAQRHSATPLPPFQLGPLKGEAWINGCSGWTPQFAAKDVMSTGDVQLVPYPQSRDVRCFISGITGAWSSTRSGATVQPFAEIYEGPGHDVRLRVSPGSDARDRVAAFASCVVIR